MPTRAPGFYWVRYRVSIQNEALNDRWEVAAFDGATWGRVGQNRRFTDSNFAEIGPRIPAPDEVSS